MSLQTYSMSSLRVLSKTLRQPSKSESPLNLHPRRPAIRFCRTSRGGRRLRVVAAATVQAPAVGTSQPSADEIRNNRARTKAIANSTTAPKYSPVALNQKYSGRFFLVAARAMKIASVLGAFALAIFVDIKLGRDDAQLRARARQLRDALTDLGPTFVKGDTVLLAHVFLAELNGLERRY